MRQQRKQYETPERAWQEDRIEREKELRQRYGLANKREVWKAQSTVRKFRRQARRLNAEEDPEQEEELLDKLQRLGILEDDAALEDVLDIDIEDVLGRRLQTVVERRGLASTPKEARQLVSHGHIMIDDHVVNVPGYLVSAAEEDSLRVAPGSKGLVAGDDG